MADLGKHIFQKIRIKMIAPGHALTFFAQAQGGNSLNISLRDQEKITKFRAYSHFKKPFAQDDRK